MRTFAAIVGVALVTAAVLAACSSSAERVPSDVGAPAGAGRNSSGPVGAPAGAPELGPYGNGGTGAMPSAAPSVGVTGGPAQVDTSGAFQDQAKVIKTGTLTLEVTNLDDALAAARAKIVGLGGYVSGSDESNDGDRTRATLVYRIPAARWDDALTALRGLASKVVGERTNAVEVTGQVIDLDARIRNLRATEAALQAIMARATKISDVLDVQGQLTEVRGQIEQLSSEKSHLEDQAALGTLSVDFSVPVAAVTTTREGWDPGAEVDRAVASLVGIGQGLASFAIWLGIVGLPVLVMFGVLAAVFLLLMRRTGLGRRPGSTMIPPLNPPATPASPEA